MGVTASESSFLPGYIYEEESVRAVRSRRKARKVNGSLVVMVLVIFAAGLAVAYYFSQLYTLDYQLDTLQGQISTLEAGTQDLNASIANFSSLSYVEEVATTQLGMVRASGQKVLTVAVAPPQAVGVASAAGSNTQKQTYSLKNPVIASLYQMLSQIKQKAKNG